MSENLDTGDYKVTSINLTRHQKYILDLLAVHYETSRSGVVAHFINLNRSKMDRIQDQIADRLYTDWNSEIYTLKEFLTLAKDWLVKKRVSSLHIKRIIKKVKVLHHGKTQKTK